MHITIDTNNITEQDREILAKILGPVNFAAFKQETPADVPADQAEPEKPKRTRRTKAQMEADAKAAEEAKAEPKDESERAADLAAEASQDDTPAPAADTGETISAEELKDLATQLITKDRQAMVDLLKSFNARRLAEIPEQDHGKFAAELRSKLA